MTTGAGTKAAATADTTDTGAQAPDTMKRPRPTPAPGRLLVTMHYPLAMQVVSGIMRLVERSYPGSVVGEDGTIREAGRTEADEG